MTCSEFGDRIERWLAGSLTEVEATEFEAHAAECAGCEARLEALSHDDGIPRDVAPPAAMRSRVLEAVARRRRGARWRRAALGAAAIAAAVLIALMTRPARKSASDFPGAGQELLAMSHARPEFAELDAAEKELTEALRLNPDDAALAASLARVRRQRDALRALVSQVGS